MGLRSEQEKRPFLRERRKADDLAGRWALVGATLGGTAVLDPALVAGAVPLGILCGAFAYRFNRRKAACDEVIDDPPRYDFTTVTRRQRDWFDPERLDTLNPVQVRVCRLLAEGDADLRAAVRADERAQGAYSSSRRRPPQRKIATRYSYPQRRAGEISHLQGLASDGFIDAFTLIQEETRALIEEMGNELRRGPGAHTGGSTTHGIAHQLDELRSAQPREMELADSTPSTLAQTLPVESLRALKSAGISTTVLGSIPATRTDMDLSESITHLGTALLAYARSLKVRKEELGLAAQERPDLLRRLGSPDAWPRTSDAHPGRGR